MTEQANWLTREQIEWLNETAGFSTGDPFKDYYFLSTLCNMALHALEHPAPAQRKGCSRDTDGDGNCGRPLCPECSTHPQSHPAPAQEVDGLKACPFCGGQAERGRFNRRYMVECIGKRVGGPVVNPCQALVIGVTQAEADATWNTRTQPSTKGAV